MSMKTITNTWLTIAVCLLGIGTTIGQPALNADKTSVLQQRIDGLHQHIMTYFFHPGVNLIFDYIPPVQATDRWGHLPTVKEIAEEFPNPCGWHTGMEDCALNTGSYLATLVHKYDVTGSLADAAEARRLLSGLLHLATVSPEKGFLPRAVLPDGKTYYPNSSVDQYTMFLYGLWVYYRSSLATDQDRRSIAEVITAIARRTVRDNYELLSVNGKVAQYCDIGALSTDRASRLLSLLQFAHLVDPEGGWDTWYAEKLQEQSYARLAVLNDPAAVNRYVTYAILQNQVSLVQLAMEEQSLPLRSIYLNALNLGADLVESRVYAYREYTNAIHNDNYVLGGWRTGGEGRPEGIKAEYPTVRVPCESLVIMLLNYQVDRAINPQKTKGMYAQQLAQLVTDVLLHYDYPKMRSFALIYAEMAYWIAVKENLLPHK